MATVIIMNINASRAAALALANFEISRYSDSGSIISTVDHAITARRLRNSDITVSPALLVEDNDNDNDDGNDDGEDNDGKDGSNSCRKTMGKVSPIMTM